MTWPLYVSMTWRDPFADVGWEVHTARLFLFLPAALLVRGSTVDRSYWGLLPKWRAMREAKRRNRAP